MCPSSAAVVLAHTRPGGGPTPEAGGPCRDGDSDLSTSGETATTLGDTSGVERYAGAGPSGALGRDRVSSM